MKTFSVEISTRTIVTGIAIIISLYLLLLIKDLLYSLFIAFILMSALRPVVDRLKKRGLSHNFAVSVVFLSFILFISALFSLVLPQLTVETGNLLRNLPFIISNLGPEGAQFMENTSFTQYIPTITNGIFELAGNIFSNLIFIISTLFFGFYFLIEEDLIERSFTRLFSKSQRASAARITKDVEKRMSSWFWGQITLMTIIGLMTFISLHIIGMGKYAISLAVLAGLLEAVPNIGPIIAAIPAAIIGVSNSTFLGVSIVILYFLIQQLENNMIVPLVMKKTVGINPIVTLIVLIIGGRLGGFLGILLAIPLYVLGETILRDITDGKSISEILR